MKRVHVVAGVIINDDKQLLIARRPLTLHQGGKWEFPGGKVENDENAQQALIRELKEEVNLDVKSTKPMLEISHDYPDKQVLLDIHWVNDFTGIAKGLEGQEIAWVTQDTIGNYEFPAANVEIVKRLQNSTL